MTERRDPDRLISAYFAQPAPDLPDRAFDAIRRDIHRTRQRVIVWPWSRPEGRRVTKAIPIAVAIFFLLSLLLLSLPGLTGGGPVSSPMPTPDFRSPLYGYSLVIPEGWTATPATIRWNGRTQPSQDPTVDQISGPHLIALGVAGPFAGNLNAFVADRIAATARDHADTCPPNALQTNEATRIGGQPGDLTIWNCGALIEQVMTVHAGVGYDFTIRDKTFKATLDPVDLANVRSMLDSVIFPVAPIKSP